MYTLTDLVSFGNYLLSEQRKQLIESHPEPASSPQEAFSQVSDADVSNWKELYFFPTTPDQKLGE